MENFFYHCPTQVVFGANALNEAARCVKEFGGHRVLLHYGSPRSRENGFVEGIKNNLEQNGIGCVTLGGVMPNPRISLVREGIELCRRENIDFLLALGGGSVIDSCKAIALGMANPERDVWDFFIQKLPMEKCLPVGAIPTIAASGSETSDSCVITNDEGKLKRGIHSQIIIPRFALMNPALTCTLPPYQTACGVVDILMHTIDRYFGEQGENELTDAIAEGLMRVVIKNGMQVMHTPDDLHARSELMWAGSISHNSLTGLGRIGDFSVHRLGSEFSGLYDCAHGATLSAVYASWARYVCQKELPRFARIARNVWGVSSGGDILREAHMGIASAESFFITLGMPVSIPHLLGRKAEEKEIEELAERCTFYGKRKIGLFAPLEKEDIIAIYRDANQ